MHQLIIASNNKGKIKEIKALLSGIELLSMSDVGFYAEIEEPFQTFAENAFTKAFTLYEHAKLPSLADDSGLCVDALSGAPGVDSAYFSGTRDNAANINTLLAAMQDVATRDAHFKAVLCLIWQGKPQYFEGICKGTIAHEPCGSNGFGYDPVFIPEGYQLPFAMLDADVKNSMSHRAKALGKLTDFLKLQTQTN
jgi:XTP/dITP diphosphohydrolase